MATVEAAMGRLWKPPSENQQRSSSPSEPAGINEALARRSPSAPARGDGNSVRSTSPVQRPHVDKQPVPPRKVFEQPMSSTQPATELTPARHSYLLHAVRKQGQGRLLLWKLSGEMWGLYRWRVGTGTRKAKQLRDTVKKLQNQLEESVNVRHQQQVATRCL